MSAWRRRVEAELGSFSEGTFATNPEQQRGSDNSERITKDKLEQSEWESAAG